MMRTKRMIEISKKAITGLLLIALITDPLPVLAADFSSYGADELTGDPGAISDMEEFDQNDLSGVEEDENDEFIGDDEYPDEYEDPDNESILTETEEDGSFEDDSEDLILLPEEEEDPSEESFSAEDTTMIRNEITDISDDVTDDAADNTMSSITVPEPDQVPVESTPFSVKVKYNRNAPKNSAIGGKIPANKTVYYPNNPLPDPWNYSDEDNYGGTHRFTGWYADKKCTMPVTNLYGDGLTKNKTLNLYAGWEARTYNITYKIWGIRDGEGIGDLDPMTFEAPSTGTCGQAISLKNLKPVVPEGLTFKYWVTGTDEKPSKKKKSISAKNCSDITLYAYCDMDYRIDLHGAEDGQIRSIPAKAFTAKKLTEFKKLKWNRDGFFFYGWTCDDPSLDGTLHLHYKDAAKVSFSKKGDLLNKTYFHRDPETNEAVFDLYALYIDKTAEQKVVFLNGEESKVAYHTVGTTAGKTFFKENTSDFHAPKGYKISGWIDQFTGKKVTGIPKTDYRSEITLKASLSAKKVKVTYANNAPAVTGVKAAKKTKERSYGSGKSLLKNPFKVSGYSFTYWSLDPEGTKKIALSGKGFVDEEAKEAFHEAVAEAASSKKPMTVKLYANWTPNRYTYIYDDDGDGVFDEIIEEDYDKLKEDGLRTPAPREGCRFLGWKLYQTDKSGVVKYKNGKPVKTKTALKGIKAKNIAAYASWKEPLIRHPVEVPEDAINVLDYGAIPNDGKDDRQAITNAIAAASPCSEENPNASVSDDEIKTVYIPAGVYDIKIKSNGRGIDLYGDDWNDDPSKYHPFRSNYVKILMEDGTELVAHTSNMGGIDSYALFYLRFTEHVTIEGGILNGSRSSINTSGLEHLVDASGAKHLNISYTAMINSYGDGVYLGESYKRQPDDSQKLIRAGYVTIDHCVIKNSRRNNIAIVGADNVTISNCEILDAYGLQPMCGIDIEPNLINGKRTPCKHILIEDTRIHAKRTGDWYNYFCVNILGGAGTVCAKDVTFRNCRFEGDVYIGCMEKSSFHEENVKVTGTYYKEWN